jgi:ATP-binding cassette subfamily F protein uup
VVLYKGNFETYRRLKEQAKESAESRAEPVSTAASSQLASRESNKKSRKSALSFKEQRELEGLPETIEATENQLATCNARLCDPATYAQAGSEIPLIQAELANLKALLEQQMARWEELERKKADFEPGL